MHRKILVIDKRIVFIGTANLTESSLKLHENLVVGIHSKDLSQFFIESIKTSHFTKIAKQFCRAFLLPNLENEPLQTILKTIEKAKKSIYVALFTLTHETIVDSLIAAKRRGIDVRIIIDYYAGRGAGKPVILKLAQEKIPFYLSQGGELLHHKWAYIDRKKLILGSANWTKAAFQKNQDCVLFLSKLSSNQKKYLDSLWHRLESLGTCIDSPDILYQNL